MSNKRLLRDTTDSEIINDLTEGGEVFFYRLMMKADDFGNFHGNVKLVRAALYPLKDTVRDSDVVKWIAECEAKKLIVIYGAEGKSYIHIINFGQKLKRPRRIFPEPPKGTTRDKLGQLGTSKDKPGQLGTTEDNVGQKGTSFSEVEVEGEIEGEVEITLPRSFFRIKDQLFKLGPGDYFKQTKASELEAWQMNHPGERILVQVLERMNRDYVGTNFNSESHLHNTFKHVWSKVKKEGPTQISKPGNEIG